MSGPDLEKIFEPQRTLAPQAVGTQVLLMSAISVATVLVFNTLRPKNKMIYEPKVKYHTGDKPPPRISDSWFGWLPPLIRTKEPELLDKVGLDAVAFLRFSRLLRWLFTGITVLTCGILIPLNVVFNLKNVDSKDRDILSMLTIRNVGGNILYAHVAMTYVITLFIIGTVWWHWKKMLALRLAWFRSPEHMQSFYARTLAVQDVPRKYQSDEGLREVFRSVQMPYPTTSVHIGRRVGDLPDLIEAYNTNVRQLEQYLVLYLKGGRVGKKRPTVRIGATCGLGGRKIDAIDLYTEKLRRMEARIEQYRNEIDTRKAEKYGFASLAAVPYAHVVAKMLAGKHPKGTEINLAPNPKDILWKNMSLTNAEIRAKSAWGFFWLVVLCFVNTIPLFIISVLANLDQIKAYPQFKFLNTWSEASPGSFALISGVLPPTVSGIFGFFLPIIMRKLSKYMGSLTHSKLDRQVVARYFAFLVISQLVIFTLMGVLFQFINLLVRQVGKKSFEDIIHNLDNIPDEINSTYINQSSYWLTFFPLRGFLLIFDLAQIVNLVWIFIKTRLFGRTPRDIREWTQPPEFQYAIYYSNLLFMASVGLVFAPLAPLVALASCVVFWLGSWVYKYQLMFVFITKVESGGRMWNVVINRLLFCVVLMQALMTLTMGLQFGFRSLLWISTLPPIALIIIFKLYINRAFVPKFRYYLPSEEEIRSAKVHSERADNKGNRLEKRFGHPALHAELFTPMLHAKMMPLLSQVYKGKIGKEDAKLGEYGGQKMEAQVVEGIKIAAIDQRDLEYDPALYRRDRGELDWDTRSIASSNMLDGASMYQGNAGHTMGTGGVPPVPGYDQYLAGGPTHQHAASTENFELTRIDSQSEPLLAHQFSRQNSSFPSSPPQLYHDNSQGFSREAPIHRPQESYGNDFANMRSQTPYSIRTTSPGPIQTMRSQSPGPAHSPYMDSPQQHYSSSSHQQYASSPHQQYASSPHQQYASSPHQQYPSSPHQQYPPQPQQGYFDYSYTQSPTSSPPPQHPREGSNNNMAGRGTYRN